MRPALLPLVTCWMICVGGMAGLAAPDGALPQVARDGLPEAARGQLDALESEVEAAAKSVPADAVGLAAAYGELGGFYFLYDFLDAAEMAWQEASDLQPEAFRWHYLLGAMLRLQGDFDAAASRLERGLEIRPNDIPSLIRLARIRTDQGDIEAARQLFERVLAVRPTVSAAQYGLGRIAIMEGRFDDAIAHLEAALPGQPEGTTVHHQLGLAYRALGDLDNARLQLGQNRGVRVGFSDPMVEGLIGMIEGSRVRARSGIQAHRSGRLEVAIEMLGEAVRLDPNDAWIRYNLGVVYQDAGNAAAAEREFQAAVELDPEYRNAQYNLAQLLVDRGDLQGAVRHFGRAREIDPEDHLAWLDMSVALSRLGESERARMELEALIEAAPALVEARVNLATLQAQLGRSAEAMRQVEQVLAGDATVQELASAYLLKARIVESTDPAAAVTHYRAAVDLDAASSEARYGLAMALGRQRRFGEAAGEFEELVRLAPDDAELRMGQTMALLLGEDYPAALAALEAATARLPQVVALSHSLGRLLATCPDDTVRDGTRALTLAQQTLEREQTIEHAETVGMALAELGRFEEAAALQQQILGEVHRQGAPPQRVALSQRYLTMYQRDQPVRAPWFGGNGS